VRCCTGSFFFHHLMSIVFLGFEFMLEFYCYQITKDVYFLKSKLKFYFIFSKI
jgi:hypothetical protein